MGPVVRPRAFSHNGTSAHCAWNGSASLSLPMACNTMWRKYRVGSKAERDRAGHRTEEDLAAVMVRPHKDARPWTTFLVRSATIASMRLASNRGAGLEVPESRLTG